MERQSTFEDLNRVKIITSLTPKQKRIAVLLEEGLSQGTITTRLHISRSFVSQTVTMLEKHSLLKRKSISKYNAFYELSPALKNQISDHPLAKLTTCRVHNIRRKYTVITKSHQVSVDQRAGFMKKWEMRGGTRYKFWYSGKAGEPSITIDVHPKTIVAYPDKGQSVIAESIEEAEDKTKIIVHNAVQKFITMQQRFNVHIHIEEVGKTISDPHYGFALQKGTVFAEGGTTLNDFWIDKSPQDLGNPDQVEFETKVKEKATPLDNAIRSIVTMPEAMKDFEKTFGTMTTEMHTVMAHIQSGQPLDIKVNQLIVMFGDMLKQQHEILERMDKA